MAFSTAVFSIFFMTDAGWWTPDYIIQGLMLLIFFIFVYEDGRYLKNNQLLFILGLFTGIIILLKHNIGIFFTIVCATILLFQCIISSQNDNNNYKLNKFFTYFIFVGFLAFGFFFGYRLLFFDEIVFYLVPYFIFFMLFGAFLIKSNRCFSLNDTIKKEIPFGLGVIVLPLIVFLWFGIKIGLGNYAYSLFGMGFQYLKIWDHGIVGVIGLYFNPTSGSINALFLSPIFLAMFLFPFLVNCYALYTIYHKSKTVHKVHEPDMIKLYKIVVIGILSIFMLFPLEGFHILATKIFIFIYIFFTLIKDSPPNVMKYITYGITILAIFTIFIISTSFVLAITTPSTSGVSDLKNAIGIPLSDQVANEMENQIMIINRSVHNEPYYIIDGSGAGIFYLASILPNKYPQYYVEMRPGILSEPVSKRIIKDISGVNYVIVRSEDYYNSQDLNMLIIINNLKENWTVKDQYSINDPKKLGTNTEIGFLVLERKSSLHR